MNNHVFLEEVCAKCPGSQWGKSAMCRIHDMHIGKVQSCPEWEGHQAIAQEEEHQEQIAWIDLEPAMEYIEKTWEDLTGYHWMIKEIERLKRDLDKVTITAPEGSALVAQYGIEATLPKGKGKKVAYLSVSEERYEKKLQRMKHLEEKVRRIQEAADKITCEKERAVIECILDGERMNFIARHVGISRQYLNEIRRKLIKKMAWELYSDELIGA
ncbi:hypothetical protein [Aneurinibacillus migulanus]|uniref:DNA-binding response regulator, NarL/FixJ family, contains REC and HTH domains n=2 Tax=Aneurinibacillus migulanus TaxID=47500 RepID=A0A0D1Y0F3_ANEMI|nr:hypothetical protein [Aneurinibacillus migulanus]KIV52752.1 hypothetical protein TS65_21645 [Aneurinibacillus migulanus]KIV56089.1 hypothetical protein TS64_11495 [Aneurinibacillus migulanus]MCP1359087.1 hypothetical protein [Aneurinibacillus migulanus]MED0896684.1 hypothetical protein [Aneurinibacillus migulanus]MED1617239.1 hypothetical protein [Aneurinibacillus migulanus]